MTMAQSSHGPRHGESQAIFGPLGLTSDNLRDALARPTEHGLVPTVWYALNAPQSTIDETPDHTLAGHLGLTAAGMEQALEAAQLKEGKGRGARSWRKQLDENREMNDSPVQLTLYTDRNTNLKWIALGNNDVTTTPQPVQGIVA